MSKSPTIEGVPTDREMLAMAAMRLDMLKNFGAQIITIQDPAQMLDAYCKIARDVIGADWSMIGVLDINGAVSQICTSGFEQQADTQRHLIHSLTEVAADMTARRTSIRLHGGSGEPAQDGVRSLVGAPIMSPSEVFGWLCLANCTNGQAFTDMDENLVTMLAGHLAISYENRRLLKAAERRNAELEEEIAHRREAQEALGRSEEKYRRLVETANEGVWMMDANHNTVFVNDKVCQILGCSREEVLGRTLFSFMDEDGVRDAEAEWIGLRGGLKARFDCRLFRSDGSALWAIVASSPLFDKNTAYMGAMAVITDITERKMMEEIRAHFAAIIAFSDDAIISKSIDGDILSWNAGAERLYGYTPGEAIGQNISILAPPDRKQEIAEILVRLRSGEPVEHFETVRVTKDGRAIQVSLTISPIYNESGLITAASTIARDITESKRAEAEIARARDLALEAERLKSEFLSNINHELRTPMNGIIGCTDLFLETELTAEQQEYLGMVKESADRMMSLVDSLLTFADIDPAKLFEEDFDTDGIFAGRVASLAEQARSKGLVFRRAVSPDVPRRLRGDAARLTQILINLVANAVKFTSRGEIVITVDIDSRDNDTACLHYAVRDTGLGIPPDKLDFIFQAFTQVDGSLARTYQGAGLGLAICRQMARMMGGHVWADSEYGQGSCFHFSAPFRIVLHR